MVKFLTIAGSDSSGGAGIQADLKTACAHKAYGMSVITSLTAQNTKGVTGVFNCSGEFVTAQMDAVFSDIPPDAVKIGMVSSTEIINAIADSLVKYSPRYVVCDTVMISTSGCPLLDADALETLVKRLIPLSSIITPNIPEAEFLWDNKIENFADMVKCGEYLSEKFNAFVLIKGGHLSENADDILFKDGKIVEVFKAIRIDNPNTHGTGCTLSSAIACRLGEGKGMVDAVRLAKEYVRGAILDGLDIGAGQGPLNHLYLLK